MRNLIDPPAIVAKADSLESLAARINAAHEAGEGATRQGLEHFRAAGESLVKAKEQCGHGKWLPWLKKNVKFTDRRARQYMQFSKSEVTSDLEAMEDQWRHCSGNSSDDDDAPAQPPPDYVTLDQWNEAGKDARKRLLKPGDNKATFNAQGDNESIEWALWSWNPVTGCLHNCPYCLDPATPILYADMAWRPIGNAKVGDVLLGFDEYPAPGRTRKLRPAVVERVWWSRQKTSRITTMHGTVTTTPNHLWLRSGANRWSRTDHLKPGHKLRYIGQHGCRDESSPTADYRAGYVAGMTIGDGTFRYLPEQRHDRSAGPQPYWRVALADAPAILRLNEYLAWFDINAPIREFNSGPNGGPAPMRKVETRAVESLDFIHRRVQEALHGDGSTIDFARGVVAGFFDAEGSAGHGPNGTSLRMKQKSVAVLERIRSIAATRGFSFKLEQFAQEDCATIRLEGPLRERLRFFGEFNPAISRKAESVFGLGLDSEPAEILAIEGGQQLDVVDIQTSTRTFYAAGLATHNCYARDIAERFYDQKFAPSLWPARLAAPQNTPFPEEKIAQARMMKGREDQVRAIGLGNVFTCSMADLFGRWVPEEWIEAVLAEVRQAKRWNFLFLTKFPQRMVNFDFPDNAWVGTTVDCQARVANAEKAFRKIKAAVKWLSCEPLLEPLRFVDIGAFDWIVLGGSSRSAKTPEWIPPRQWWLDIEEQARKAGVRYYEKTNLWRRDRQYPGVEPDAEPDRVPDQLRYLPTVGA